MTISDIIGLLSGIALFLFGMTLMGDGLKSLSGNKLEPILYKLSGTPAKGLLLGSGVTAVIQSSSATSVIVMGFVNSGMMKLGAAIPVIIGAIFGTSITGWVICLSYIEGAGSLSQLLSTATLTGVVAVVGIILKIFCKGKIQHYVGDILMGFVQALSVTGAIVFDNALPLLMGISIGAALPVMIASLGTSISGRRTALSYLVACFMGVMACGSIFYISDAVFTFPFEGMAMNPFSIALVNTIFRFLMMLVLIPFLDILEALVCQIIPDKSSGKKKEIILDDRFTKHPSLAIEQSRIMINHMAEEAAQAVSEASILIERFDEKTYHMVEQLEDNGDEYEDVLGAFLMKLSSHELSDRQEKESTIFLHTLSDYERISDHAMKVANSAKEINEKKISFSDEAAHEIAVMASAVREILQLTVAAFDKEDVEIASNVEPLEEVIDDISDSMKLNHIERLQNGSCNIEQGFIFNDIITDYERISDHCANIAVALIEIYSDTSAEQGSPEYMRESEHYDKCYEEYKSRFSL